VTTPDQITGRSAATRRSRGAALLCACLFAAPALPAFAMQPVAPTAANPALHAPASGTASAAPVAPAAPAAAPAASTVKPAAAADDDTVVVLDQPMQMSDRALLLASDINRLIAKPGAKPAGEDVAPATTGSRIQSVLQRALTLLGTPYRWGGTTTNGFDCSGLVGYVFRTTLGIELPRVSRDMARTGQEVDRASLVPGDLVFFGRRGRVDHVGIYLGEGRFVHAPRTGREVTVSKLDGYWGRKFLEARRVAGI
jgi:cell wall-associated NlpC family hydrolase